MRIVDSIPHASMTISIFQMNDRFQVRFEAGPMEQIFKFDQSEVGSLSGLKEKISNEFIEQTRQRFNEMFIQMRQV